MTQTKKGAKSARANKANQATAQAVQVITEQVAGVTTANQVEPTAKPMTAKQEQARNRREELRNLSAGFQAKRQMLEMMGQPVPTINEMILAHYAKEYGTTELNTYDQWQEKGYQVKRGEKAFLVWGKPKNHRTITTTDEETGEEKKEEVTTDDFYPVCYLFDIKQCHQITA